MKKILAIAVISLTLLVSCKNGDLKTYTSDNYTFNYPVTYFIKEPTPSFPALTAEGENGRIEIFQMKDFGDRPFGFTGEKSEKDIAKYIPKKQLKSGEYELWLYYNEEDNNTKQEIENIADSFKTNE